jgi:hypothetical protein
LKIRGEKVWYWLSQFKNQLPRSKLRGIKKSSLIIFSKLSPPNVLVGGPVGISPGFPPKACGNDGLGEGANSTQQAAGNLTRLD